MKRKLFIVFVLLFMFNYSYGFELDVSSKELSFNEKEINISGFERSYGVAVNNNLVLIPEFSSGLIYEINLKNNKTKILKRISNKLVYLTETEQTNLSNIKNPIIRPHDIYFDNDRNMYISEMGNGEKGGGKISVFDRKYNLIKEIGTEMYENFGMHNSIMIYKNNNNFFITENGKNRILRFNKNYEFIDWIGKKNDKNFPEENETNLMDKNLINIDLKNPHAVKIGPFDNIYIADTGNHRILRFGTNGEFKGWIGKREDGNINNSWQKKGVSIKGSELGAFNAPNDMIITNNYIYVSETENDRIVRISLDGKNLGRISIDKNSKKYFWSNENINKIDLKHPFAIKIQDNVIFIADRRNNRIKIIYSKNLF